jgi:hypothetical protein
VEELEHFWRCIYTLQSVPSIDTIALWSSHLIVARVFVVEEDVAVDVVETGVVIAVDSVTETAIVIAYVTAFEIATVMAIDFVAAQ